MKSNNNNSIHQKSDVFVHPRAHQRFPFSGETMLYDVHGYLCFSGNHGDLSKGGMSIKGLKKNLSIGDDVAVEFKGSNDLQPFRALGEVVRLSTPKNTNHSVAIKFTAINSNTERILNLFEKQPLIK